MHPPGDVEQLVPLVYDELKRIAHRQLVARAGLHTLRTTELVHEAYLKLADHSHGPFADRSHFLAVVSLAMRHLLVDRAKAHAALKRGGAGRRVTLDEERVSVDDQAEALLQLDEALSTLARFDQRLSQVVVCRFFGGLTEEETANALGVTVRTVQRDWAKARVLLQRALSA